jgi:hypothetical protein
MMGLPRGAELEGRASESVDLWDNHVTRCAECLIRGNELCAEGVYLTLDVVQRRSALEAHQNRILLAGGSEKRSFLRGHPTAA